VRVQTLLAMPTIVHAVDAKM